MSGCRFIRVTRPAGAPRRRPGVLLVAIRARAMPSRRGAMFVRVAVLTALSEGTAVRFVAARALSMSRCSRRVDGGVTALAAGLQARRSMRQASVTTLTRGVARERRHLAQLLGVTTLADGSVRSIFQKRVRRVTLFAANAAVKRAVRGGGLMTRAAIA